jgi:predicted DNA binding CopG/RHH family protein
MSLNAVELVNQYIKLRDTKEMMNALIKEKLQPITQQMEEIETQLKTILDEMQVDSIKTVAGTFFKKTTTSVTVRDMDEVLSFVKEHDAYDLFERKVNKTATMAYIDDGVSVPGVEVNTEIKVQIRR